MIPTPNLSHLTPADYELVYEPAEDTFLLLDALELDANDLLASKPLICLEIGSGSGCVSSFAGSIIGRSAALYLCTDVNNHACLCTMSTGAQNSVPLESINASFATPLLHRLQHSVDVILFNPPYVPTASTDLSDGQHVANIQASWAGGVNGMEVTNSFLPHVQRLLSAKGRFYLVALKQNDVAGIRRRMYEEFGLRSEVVVERQAGRERLHIPK